jgi:hypothetical protein
VREVDGAFDLLNTISSQLNRAAEAAPSQSWAEEFLSARAPQTGDEIAAGNSRGVTLSFGRRSGPEDGKTRSRRNLVQNLPGRGEGQRLPEGYRHSTTDEAKRARNKRFTIARKKLDHLQALLLAEAVQSSPTGNLEGGAGAVATATPQPGASTAPAAAPPSPEDEDTENVHALGASGGAVGSRALARTRAAPARPALASVSNLDAATGGRSKQPRQRLSPPTSVKARRGGEAIDVGPRRVNTNANTPANPPFRNPCR